MATVGDEGQHIRAMLIEGGYNGKAELFMNYRVNPIPNDINLEPK